MLKKQFLGNARSLCVPAFTIGVVTFGLLSAPARAGQLQGQGFFDHAPRLIRSAASYVMSHTPATYEFTISVPSDAGAALQTVKIVQEQNIDRVRFDSTHSSAFLGDSFAGGPSAPLAAIGGEMPKDRSEAVVMFNPPIQPGQTVTVALNATMNPWNGGVYLFGVTAYPEGDQTSGLFLGFGRIYLQSY